MLDKKPRFWFVALAAMVGIAVTRVPASAGGKNAIRAVAIADDQGTTTIRAQGGETPTFTVYKLERPTRVVVDIAQATLADAVGGDDAAATFSVGSWAVGQVAAMAVEDGSSTVRVIVTLARPGRYDVKAIGKDVVIKVTARDPAPKNVNPAELATAQAAAEQARKDADASKAAADKARAEADGSKQESRVAIEAAQRLAAEQKLAADRARAEADGSSTATPLRPRTSCRRRSRRPTCSSRSTPRAPRTSRTRCTAACLPPTSSAGTMQRPASR